MDHISFPIADAERTRAFYEPVLKTLGWRCSGSRPGLFVAFKKAGSPALYFNVTDAVGAVHLAFKASGQVDVVAFYDAALAAGGSDNGRPGPRPDYGADYFAAFVLDPDGHNVEAVVGGVG